MFALSASAQTNFRAISYDEAIAAAKAENKLVFMDFYTDWCGPCKRMASEVFPQKEVGDYMNAKFVCIKLNAEKEGKELADLYKVEAYPTFIGIDTDKKVVMTKVGATSTGKEFITDVDLQINPDKNPEKLKARYEGGERTPELIASYAALKLSEFRENRDMAKRKEAFSMVRDYYHGLSEADRLSPKNLFVSVNSRYFGMDKEGNGVLVDCERFRFAEGELALPREVRVEKDGDGWRAVWQDERLAVSGAASDRLQAGVIYDALPMGVRMALEVEGTRGDGTGRFVLDGGMMGREAMERRRRELEAAGRHEAWMDAEGELPEGRNGGAHVYLYFMREDGTAFSPSAYFRLTIND